MAYVPKLRATWAPPFGLAAPGNLDLNARKVYNGPEGDYRTENSITIGTDQGEVLIPTVIGGRQLSEEAAIQHYELTGEHLGIFKAPDDAERYAETLHKRQEQHYAPPPRKSPMAGFGLGNYINPQVGSFIDQRRNALAGLGAGLLNGQPGAGVQAGIQADDAYAVQQKAEAERQKQIADQNALKSKYAEWFTQQGQPQIAQGIADGIIEPGQAYWDFISPKAPDIPDAVQALDLRAQRAGLAPGSKEYNDFMIAGGAGGGQTINNVGSIPAGYKLDYDAQGRPVSMSPIAGSPAATDAANLQTKADNRSSSKQTLTDTVLNEAQKAREAAKGFGATGVGNWVLGGAGFTPAGELNSHVESLKSIAAAENINAMRQESPTGAALGNASDRDIALLKNKAGALNPQSPNFDAQLDDYELTLLRIVHGYDAGTAIYQKTRSAEPAPGGAPAGAVPSAPVVDMGGGVTIQEIP